MHGCNFGTYFYLFFFGLFLLFRWRSSQIQRASLHSQSQGRQRSLSFYFSCWLLFLIFALLVFFFLPILSKAQHILTHIWLIWYGVPTNQQVGEALRVSPSSTITGSRLPHSWTRLPAPTWKQLKQFVCLIPPSWMWSCLLLLPCACWFPATPVANWDSHRINRCASTQLSHWRAPGYFESRRQLPSTQALKTKTRPEGVEGISGQRGLLPVKLMEGNPGGIRKSSSGWFLDTEVMITIPDMAAQGQSLVTSLIANIATHYDLPDTAQALCSTAMVQL